MGQGDPNAVAYSVRRYQRRSCGHGKTRKETRVRGRAVARLGKDQWLTYSQRGSGLWSTLRFICVLFGDGFVESTFAEMESMAQTSGGQYHWVPEFPPKQYQKFLSYAAGKSTLPFPASLIACRMNVNLGMVASASSSVFVLATLVESIISVSNADFVFPC